MKTNNMEINTQEYWTAKLDNILYRISMNTYELGVFCDGINTLRIAILVNPINRNHTKWEANLLGYMNDQIIENVGTLFLVRGNSKTGVFHNIVEELKKANSKSLIRDGVNSILEDWVPRSIREQLKALDRAAAQTSSAVSSPNTCRTPRRRNKNQCHNQPNLRQYTDTHRLSWVYTFASTKWTKSGKASSQHRTLN